MDTGAEGGNMVFVKVRETYDLHTVKDKMTVIGIHTPKPDIIKRNYPGLLMQCKAYRPYSCDVRVACASLQSLDPLQVGTSETDIAPEDVFNPILYKAMSNKGMSQLEARINAYYGSGLADVDGDSASVDVDTFTSQADEFNLYYGLLANTHDWKHAAPQAGLSMSGLRPLVYEMVYNVGDTYDQFVTGLNQPYFTVPDADSDVQSAGIRGILGKSKEMPFINCTSYTYDSGTKATSGEAATGFTSLPWNAEVQVPYINTFVGCIIVPPSKLHELFYRMVVEWTIEFTGIRPVVEILTFGGVADLGSHTHYQNYSYSSAKKAITGSDSTILDSDSCMVAANVDVQKVM